jgi:hypothetical protein
MTDRSKFEQMLEYLISEEQDKAKELFHQLVVEKSRQIYEEILSEDFEEEDVEEGKDEDEDDAVEESTDDEDDMEEGFGFEADDMGDDEMSGDEIGGDATDDFLGDIEAGDEEGDDMGGDGDIEDRVVDLEDALDDLKMEFEKMMGGEGDDMGDMGDEEGMDDMGGDDMGDMGDEEEVKDSFSLGDNFMREYIEKVANPKHGDDGVNNKSIVAGKNDMGGTTANMVKGGTEGGKGVQSGLLKPNTKEENFGNINVPGGNAGKTAFKKKEPGHGAEKKGSGDNGDKSAGSPINGVKSRAK